MKKIEFLYLAILCIFVFLSSQALFHDGFFRTDDDLTPVRITYMEKELLQNNWLTNFPVRMSGELSHNYGYPLYLFYAPLTYYAGAAIMLVGISSIVASKYIFVFPLLLGSFIFYFAVRQKLPPYASFIAALFFSLFPYRGYDTYIRGAVAEAWGIAFLPLTFAGLFLIQKQNRFGGIIFAVGLFLTIISHHLVGMMLIAFVLLYGMFFLRKSREYWKFFLIGLGLAAFYILPLLAYLKEIKVTYLPENTTELLTTLVPFSELTKVVFNQAVYTVSGLFFYLFVGGLLFFLYKKRTEKKIVNEIFFWGISGFVLYLLLADVTKIIWQITLPVTGVLQFPWRVLSLIAFILPLFLGFWISYCKTMYAKVALSLLFVLISLNFLPMFKPTAYSFYYEYSAEGECATASHQNEYLPKAVLKCPPPKPPFETKPEAKIALTKDRPLHIQAKIETNKDVELTINKYYFPGWNVLVDGNNLHIAGAASLSGTMKTNLKQGSHTVEARYEKTALMWLADSITIISLGVLAYYSVKYIPRKKRLKR